MSQDSLYCSAHGIACVLGASCDDWWKIQAVDILLQDALRTNRQIRQMGGKPHLPRLLLSASAEYEWATKNSQSPRLDRIAATDPRVLDSKMYCPRCVTPPLGERAGGFPVSAAARLEANDGVSEAVAGALAKGDSPPDNLIQARQVLEQAVDVLQTKQEAFQNQLLFHWIELQLLQRQGLETHRALVRGHREVANATWHLTQYLGRFMD